MSSEDLEVWIDQDLCTGDGLCVQYAADVFELDIDGLVLCEGRRRVLRQEAGSRVAVPGNLILDVVDSAEECPGECIHVHRRGDGVAVAGPLAEG